MHYGFGVAPEDSAAYSSPAVGAHDDQLRAPPACFFHDQVRHASREIFMEDDPRYSAAGGGKRARVFEDPAAVFGEVRDERRCGNPGLGIQRERGLVDDMDDAKLALEGLRELDCLVESPL